ncbi:aldo/keto reductase [Halopseudomonas yangmingensis]|uniref:Predicted oxidoreductase n=1 Tax=Halopseudomonas yangmingensis TaxID=1720063 RepID=A0A1I4N970_9GAMM|nr:aldo/keto reductase [Halopseudomonas yangmingensis]SFM12039.1 Predicted oxidoreductase [Halopseudomonas yangmingensis]
MQTLQPHWRALGSTGLQVSPLGLGTVKLGRNQGVKYPNGFELPDDRSASALLAQARELGINLLDTAPAYGSSEERLGQLLAGQRQHWVLCSKVGEEFDGQHSHFDFSAAHTRRSVERSLQRLRTDYLDLVLVHSSGDDLVVLDQEVCTTLQHLREEGLIRAWGFSGKTVEGGIRALQQADCAMVTYNLQQRDELPVLDFALSQGKGILIKKAFASGHLPGSDPATAVVDSLRLVLGHPAVASAIVGTINPRHLQDNVTAALQVL